jgi:Ca2+-binding RTX toxin-like protein
MTIRTTTALAAAVAALTLSAAPSALATDVSRNDIGTFTGLTATDILNEDNTAAIQIPVKGTFNFRDTTSPLTTAANGCTRLEQGKLVTCEVDPSRQTVMSLSLGGGDDIGVARPLPADVQNGGPGGFEASINGGEGADTLASEGPVTTFYAGNGSDKLISGPKGDQLFGEAGVDTVDYSTHPAGVVVDLVKDVSVQGTPGEGDRIKGVENALGTIQGDTLFGDAEDNYLYGDKGADKLSGREGDDVIEARDASTDQIGCGTGSDQVFANQSDVVSADCETVTRSGIPQGGNGLGTPGQKPPLPAPPGPAPGPGQDPAGGDPSSSGGGGTGGGPAVAKDTTAPKLSKVAFLRKTLKRGKRTNLLYRLSEPAGLSIRLERVLPGLRRGKRCVAPTTKLRRAKAKRCTRAAKVATLTRGGGLAGLNSTSFDAKAGKKGLKPGSYRAVLVAADAAGNTSARRTAALRVVS